MSKTTKYITRAAVIFALTIALQFGIRAVIPSAPPFNIVNLFLVVLFWLATRKGGKQSGMRWLGLVVGAAAKMAFLYYTIGAIVGTLGKLPAAAAAFIRFSFSWPQFVTAVIGGILSSLIASRIKSLT
jgi:hypothetical protein